MVHRTLAVVCVISLALFAQVAGAARTLVFSGTISELEAKRITVHRRSSGHAPDEKKTFVITDATKVEGQLRLSARVTIGFIPGDQGDIATRIIVRPENSRKN